MPQALTETFSTYLAKPCENGRHLSLVWLQWVEGIAFHSTYPVRVLGMGPPPAAALTAGLRVKHLASW